MPAIHFTGIDQPASQVLIDQLYSQCKRSIWADKLDYTYIEKNNSFSPTVIILMQVPLVAAEKEP
ncbi:MAG: hypothetical protein IPP79_09640 [Chitinophagaceae bacterium]|nr:hypothetical protein [Chitinophagaceae bacterium]